MASLVGKRFGRYEVEEKIASGGMAEVWRARLTGSAGFEKQVALKMLHPELCEIEDLVQLFIGEAAMAAEINHPNVVQVFDFGCADGRYFMAMEYVAGWSLRRLLQSIQQTPERRLPYWALLEVALHVCEGLEHIHAFHDSHGKPMGLVHRDVSPENVMISWTGAVKLIDFGVARVVEAAGKASGPVTGKPRYMAPEQALGLDLDARADVFSLGVVLFACATGRLPFSGPDAQQVMEAVVQGDRLPVTMLNPRAHPALVDLIDQAMTTDRGERTPSTAVLREHLLLWAHAAGLDPTMRQLGQLLAALAHADDELPAALHGQVQGKSLSVLLDDWANHHPPWAAPTAWSGGAEPAAPGAARVGADLADSDRSPAPFSGPGVGSSSDSRPLQNGSEKPYRAESAGVRVSGSFEPRSYHQTNTNLGPASRPYATPPPQVVHPQPAAALYVDEVDLFLEICETKPPVQGHEPAPESIAPVSIAPVSIAPESIAPESIAPVRPDGIAEPLAGADVLDIEVEGGLVLDLVLAPDAA